jgi:hypothetical protein
MVQQTVTVSVCDLCNHTRKTVQVRFAAGHDELRDMPLMPVTADVCMACLQKSTYPGEVRCTVSHDYVLERIQCMSK